MLLDIFKPPECQYLSKGVCLYATRALAIRTDVTSVMCNVTCKELGGPFEGRIAPNETKWLKSLTKMDKRIIRKVKERYGSKPIEVIVPTLSNEVKKVFSHIRTLPWVKGIGITGSCLVKDCTNKDLDIVLFVDEYKDWLENCKHLNSPSYIGNYPIDLFACQSPEKTRFIMLNIETMVLYASGFYNIGKVDEKIISIYRTGAEMLADGQS